MSEPPVSYQAGHLGTNPRILAGLADLQGFPYTRVVWLHGDGNTRLESW